MDVTLRFERPSTCRLVVHRGAVSSAGPVLHGLTSADRVVWISDEAVAAKLGGQVESALSAAFRHVDQLTIRVGENAKTLSDFADLIARLHALGADRTTPLVAVGGGSTTDSVGFVAACYLRGVPYASIPTSLCAQVDAAIGGKVAVNTAVGKNMLGTFYHPRLVLVDPDLLDTCPDGAWRDGMAEIVKVALVADADLFALIESTGGRLRGDDETTDRVIRRAIRAKLRLLTPDPFEANLDRLLNFGHETAHAIETTTEHTVSHGAAVAIGVATATRIAVRRGLLDAASGDRVSAVLRAHGLPTGHAFSPAGLRAYRTALRQVALVRAGSMRVVLPTTIGAAVVANDVGIDDLVGLVGSDGSA
ncbi:3-dehydroquinate synthase family protein [Micromonospora okii]|uniref:3-dehydroquinate synthase family protein n=1 Tax=Micromonospora okii TaxID=1182970 RepID=UPI001E3176D3|nr:3-dehydroquinate synthase family protein [Micromonospora okii]